MGALLALGVAVSLLSAPAVEIAELEARVQAALDARDYGRASELLGEAFAATRDPQYLYMRGEAERLAGDCAAARVSFDEFIARSQSEAATRAATARRDGCEGETDRAPPADGSVASVEPQPGPEPTSERPPPPRVVHKPRSRASVKPPRPWYRDPWGGTLLGVGTAALAAGIGVYARGWVEKRAADRALFYDGYGGPIERAALLSRIGIAVMAVGGVAIVGAVARYATLARKRR